MTMKQRASDETRIHCTKESYPSDWVIICRAWSKFGGRKINRLNFIIFASVAQIEQLC